MNRTTSNVFCLAVLVLVSPLLSCSSPADAVAVGTLCQPDSVDCPSAIDLERPGVGRNLLEFTLRADPKAGDSAEVAVRVTTTDDIAPPDPRSRTDDGALILVEEHFAPGAGENLREEFGSFELTVASRLRVELHCAAGDCAHSMEYVYFSEAIECVDDAVCSRNEVCEQVYGRCAECTTDAHCGSDQICERDSGACFPGDTRGCHATPAPLSPLGLVLVAIGLLMTGIRGRLKACRDSSISRYTVAGALGVTAFITMGTPTVAHANTSATMNLGGGLRVLTGEVGQLTHPGWGITVNQQIQWHRLSMNFQLASNSFGLADTAGTARGNLSGYGLTVGSKFHAPLPVSVEAISDDTPFEAFGGLHYTRWSIAQNRLASVTGLDLNYHALGPTGGITWHWRGLELTSRLAYSHIFQWPGGVFSLDLLIGLSP